VRNRFGINISRLAYQRVTRVLEHRHRALINPHDPACGVGDDDGIWVGVEDRQIECSQIDRMRQRRTEQRDDRDISGSDEGKRNKVVDLRRILDAERESDRQYKKPSRQNGHDA
jgi:hypothetical protein